MQPGNSPRFRVGTCSIAILALACALAPASAWAIASRPGDGALSPRLAELAKPSVRSAPPAKQAEELSLAAEGPGSLLRDGNRVLVDVRFDHGAAAGVDELRAAGAKIVNVSPRYQTVTVAAKLAELRELEDVPRVLGATEVLTPIVSATGCAGLVTSEGDSQLGAASAREAFNLDGGGVTVGVLSDSFDTAGSAPTHAGQDVASGDLPGSGNPCGHANPVDVLDDYAANGPEEPEQADEGRAMAQIVHDLAPGTDIDFATAFKGELSFAANIHALANAGASVIVDDVSYLDEPFFQDGPVSVAANEVAGGDVAYFSAAGNNNLIDAEGRDIASWEAPQYRDSAGCPPPLVAFSEEVEEFEEEKGIVPSVGLEPEHCMDFDPGPGPSEKDEAFEINVEKDATLLVDLQWAEPWFGVGTDIDAYLFNPGGKPIGVGVEDNVNGSEQPFEAVGWKNDTGAAVKVELVINRFSGSANPRLKFALLQNGGGVTSTEYSQSAGGDTVGPTIFGHNGASGAVTVGAVRYNATSAPEIYSSRGPLTNYFGPVAGTSPASPISPQTIQKPDLAATDCGLTTFFAPTSTPSVYRFCGTSAAAPHAAAVAALMRQANPSLSLQQLRTALATTAKPVGGFGIDAVGAGLVDAFGAVSSVALPPTVSITQSPDALSKNRSPSIGFAANRPVSFTCSVDGGPLAPCTSPFVPATPLADGVHGFAVHAVDVASRGATAETGSFRVDATPPKTFFRKHPRKVIRTRHRRAKAVFRFRSNEAGVRFICRVDDGLPHFCKARFVRRFGIGPHALRVRASDAAGNFDRSPAIYRFRVKRVG